MKKVIKHKNISQAKDLTLEKNQPDLAVLINEVCARITALERKIDTLLSQATKSSSDRDHFQKSDSHSRDWQHSASAKYNQSPRENNFTQAVCSDCGKECQLPFKPSGDRPVYCKSCFSERKGSGSFRDKSDNRPEQRNFSGGRNFNRPGQSKGSRFGKPRGSFFKKY